MSQTGFFNSFQDGTWPLGDGQLCTNVGSLYHILEVGDLIWQDWGGGGGIDHFNSQANCNRLSRTARPLAQVLAKGPALALDYQSYVQKSTFPNWSKNAF